MKPPPAPIRRWFGTEEEVARHRVKTRTKIVPISTCKGGDNKELFEIFVVADIDCLVCIDRNALAAGYNDRRTYTETGRFAERCPYA